MTFDSLNVVLYKSKYFSIKIPHTGARTYWIKFENKVRKCNEAKEVLQVFYSTLVENKNLLNCCRFTNKGALS